MRRTPFRSLPLILILGALLAACAAAPASADTAAPAVEVRLTEEGFRPPTLRLHEGDEVVWVNATARSQTLLGEDGSWDSGPLRPGERFSLVLRLPGTFRYATADGAAEGQLIVSPPRAIESPERPASPEAARSLADTGASDGVLLLAALGLLLSGGVLVRTAGQMQRRAR